MPKLVRLQNKIPKLRTIIYFDSNHDKSREESIENSDNGSSLKRIALSELERNARESADTDVFVGVRQPKEDDIAVLLYTSGNEILKKQFQIKYL